MPFKGQNIKVGIDVSADVTDAKQQLASLKQTLTNLSQTNLGGKGLGITSDIEDGIEAANKLHAALEQATSSTGTLDLSAFSRSISESGLKVSDYAAKLSKLGPAGQQAFAQVASAVNQAEGPLKKADGLVSNLFKSLENVARYQVSTSILNTFTGAIQSAYRYAQDLNESLNKIQIVTGSSSSQMAEFAEKANKAAQALSTTTTEYTDAALIFYQQGLSSSEVTERTNATIKMAHATGDSATEVSSYMTAIWNNFDDGSESLEHYADVITALGASTASSSSEIAEGLSKFAAIAQTTGLSYDYATSALATLVANTRQSADTIGTSLKTIFARLQGFNLGETADDGVTLNKYSTALAKVGVEVLDATGNMKDMDTILTELAGKWNTLGDAQKNALAQTVAGTRQYTQLISLMDNWGDMEKNLETAQGSDGTLNEQANIYAESWEAAKDRVTAAAEEIYNKLIDDDFFITILDDLKSFLNGVSQIISSLGGLKGAFSAVAAIITTVFQKQMADGLNNGIKNITVSIKAAQLGAKAFKTEWNSALTDMGKKSGSSTLETTLTKVSTLQDALNKKKQEFNNIGQQANQIQQKAAEEAVKQTQQLQAQVQAQQAIVDSQKTQLGNQITQTSKQLEGSGIKEEQQATLNLKVQGYSEIETAKGALDSLKAKIDSMGTTDSTLESSKAAVQGFCDSLEQLGLSDAFTKVKVSMDGAAPSIKELLQQLANSSTAEEFNANAEKIDAALSQLETQSDSARSELETGFEQALKDAGVDSTIAAQQLQDFKDKLTSIQSSSANFGEECTTLGDKLEKFSQHAVTAANAINGMTSQMTTGQRFMALAQSLTTVSSAMSSIANLGNTLTSSTATNSEKITAAITTVTTVIFALLAVLKLVQAAQGSTIIENIALSVSLLLEAAEAKTAAMATLSFGIALQSALPILIVIVAAIAAIVAIFNAFSNAAKQAVENAEAQAEADEEAAKAAKESADAVREKTRAYEEAYVAYQKAIEADEGVADAENTLIQAARDVATAYDNEYGSLSSINTELLIAQGNYAALTEQIRAQQKALDESALAQEEKAMISAGTALTGQFTLAGDSYTGESKYTTEHGKKIFQAEFGNGKWLDSKSDNNNTIKNAWQTVQDNGGAKHLSYDSGGDLLLKTGTTAGDMAEGYAEVKAVLEEAERAAQEAGTTAELYESAQYKNLTGWLDKNKEVYEEYAQLIEDYADLDIDKVLNDDIDISNIKNQTDYDKARADAIKRVTEDLEQAGVEATAAAAQAEKAVDTYMKASSSVSAYATTAIANEAAITNASEKKGSYWEGRSTDLTNYYNGLTDEQRAVFFKLDFDAAQSEQALQNQMTTLQEIADVSPVKANLTIANSAAETLASDGASALENIGIDWGESLADGEEAIVEFDEFCSMSAEQQVMELERISEAYKQATKIEAEEAQKAILAEAQSLTLSNGQTVQDFLANGGTADQISNEKDSATLAHYTSLVGSNWDFSEGNLANLGGEYAEQASIIEEATNSCFSTIATAVKIAKNYDSDMSKLALIQNVFKQSTEGMDTTSAEFTKTLKEQDEALLDIIKDSEQLSGDEQLAQLQKIQSATVLSSKEYKDAYLNALTNSNMSLSDKMTEMNKLLPTGDDTQNAETARLYSDEITKVISSDTKSTTVDKIAAINEKLEQGIITAEDAKTAIDSLTDEGATLTNLITKQGSASQSDLEVLEKYDPAALSNYMKMSSDDWVNYCTNLAVDYYEQVATMAEDGSAEQIEAMQKVQDAKDAQIDYIYAKEKAAAEAQQEIWDEEATAQSSAMSTISSYLKDLETPSFENMVTLKDNLIKAGLAAEQVESIMNNLSSEDGTDAEKIKNGMVAAAQVALAELSTYGEQQQEYSAIITSVDLSQVNPIGLDANISVGNDEVSNRISEWNLTNQEVNFTNADDSKVQEKINSWNLVGGIFSFETASNDTVSAQVKAWQLSGGTLTLATADGNSAKLEDVTASYVNGVLTLKDADGNSAQIQDVTASYVNGVLTLKDADGNSAELQSVTAEFKNGVLTLATANGDSATLTPVTMSYNGGVLTLVDANGNSATLGEVTASYNGGVLTLTTADGNSTELQPVTKEFKDGLLTLIDADGNSATLKDVTCEYKDGTVYLTDADGNTATLQPVTQEYVNGVLTLKDADGNSASLQVVDHRYEDGILYLKTADGNEAKLENVTKVYEDGTLKLVSVTIPGDSQSTIQDQLDDLNLSVEVKFENNIKANMLDSALQEMAEYVSPQTQQKVMDLLSMPLDKAIEQMNKEDSGWWFINSGKVAWNDEDKYLATSLVSQLTEIDPSTLTKETSATYNQIMAALYNAFQNGDDSTKQLAKFLLEGLGVGLSESGDGFDWDAYIQASGMSADVAAAFKTALGIASPSKMTKAMAHWLYEGLAVGLSSGEGLDAIQSSISGSGLSGLISNAFLSEIADAKTVLKDSAGNIIDWDNLKAEYEAFTEQEGGENFTMEEWMENKGIGAQIDAASAEYIAKGYKTDSNLSATQKAYINAAVKKVSTDLNLTEDQVAKLTGEELDNFIDAVQQELDDNASDIDLAVSKVWAKIQDTWSSGLTAIYNNETETAEKVYKLWENTFKAINTARLGLISGKSIIESMFGDESGLSDIIETMLNQGKSLSEIYELIKNPDASLSDLQMNAWDFDSYDKSGKQRFLNRDANNTYQATTVSDYNGRVDAYVGSTLKSELSAAIGDTITDDYIQSLANSTKESDQILLAKMVDNGLVNYNQDTGVYSAAELKANEKASDFIDAILADVEAAMHLKTQEEVNAVLADAAATQQSQYYQRASYAESEGSAWIGERNTEYSAIDKARSAMASDQNLNSLSGEEQAEVLKVLKAQGLIAEDADITSVSLDTLNSSATLLAQAMETAAAQILQAMGMIQRGEADDFSIDADGTVHAYKTDYTDEDKAAADVAAKQSADIGQRVADANGESFDYDAAYQAAYQGALEGKEQVRQEVSLSGDSATSTDSNITGASDAVSSEDISRMKEYAEAVGMTTDEFKTYKETMQSLSGIDVSTKDGQKELDDLTLKAARTQKGMTALGKVSTDTWKTLKDSSKRGTTEYNTALSSMKTTMSQVFNTDASKITNDFVEKHLSDMEKMATGTEEEAAKAKEAIEEGLIDELAAAGDIPEFTVKVNVDGVEKSMSSVDFFKTQLDQWSAEEVGFTINADTAGAQADVINAMDQMIQSGQMTAEQINSALNAIGWEPEFEYEAVPVSSTSNTGMSYYVSDGNGGYVKWDGDVTTSDDGYVYVPHLKSASKTGGPKVNNGSRGGGGGGGSRRSDKRTVRYDAGNEKNASDEIERYHHITNALESVNHELNMISKAKDKAFGKDKLKLIEDETAALEKQKAEEEEYIKEIEDYATSDAAAAKSIGLEIDAEGHVTNYELKMDDWLNDYNEGLRQSNKAQNDAVEWWNSLSADEQNEESNKTLYEEKIASAERIATAASDEYESRKKILEQYEETMDLLDTEQEKYQDIINDLRSAMLEKIQYEVSLKVEVSEDALNILKDYFEDITEKADGATDALANFAQQAAQIQNQVQAYQNGVTKIMSLAGADEGLISRATSGNLTAEDWEQIGNLDLTADDVSTLEEYEQSLLSYNQTLRELRDKSMQKLIDGFNEGNEKIEEQATLIQHLQKVSQTYADIVDVVGAKILDSSGELTKTLDRADYEMQRNNTAALKSELDYIESSLAKTKAAYEEAKASGASQQVLEAYEEQIDEMTQKQQSAQESWMDSWKAECEAAATIYEDTLTQIVNTFEEAIAGAAGSLDNLSSEYNRQKNIDDTYLEQYDQIYQLSKLTRDINNSIDDTDNINSKKALKKLANEINQAQEEGNKLSQYDVDYLRKKYELELASEQLEEARDAKTAVRMTRDAEGNYGYVYTANADEVANAEQNYEDKLYAMQQLNSDYIDSMQEQIISAEQECSEALANLNVSDYATYEEYQAAALQIQEDYGTLVDDYYDQLNNAISNNKELYETAWSDYHDATGYQMDNEKEFVTDYLETQLARITGLKSIQDATLSFNNSINTAIQDAGTAWATWYKDTQTALSDGGTSIGTYADDVAEAVSGDGGLLDQTNAAAEKAGELEETYETTFDNILQALKDFIEEWDKVIEDQITTNQLLSGTIYDIIATAAGETAATLQAPTSNQTPTETNAPNEANTTGMASGGYTGDWGSSEGKLAILHQKELVLNADDTSNILAAVGTIRDISKAIDLNAMSASQGLASSLNSTGVATNDFKETIEQNVQITAEFKDATTASEITAAFDSLVNLASQYANRKS